MHQSLCIQANRSRRGQLLIALALLVGISIVALPGVGHAVAASPSAAATPKTTSAAPPPAAAHAAFGLGPAGAKALDDRPTFIWSSSPGGSLTDHVAVVNYSTTALTLDLYVRDAVNAPSGALTMQPKSETATGVGSWITLEIPGNKSTITVPARSTLIVPISLSVPPDAPPGDHTAGIITSLTAKTSATNGKQVVDPSLEQRVAVPVELRVSGPLHPQLTVVPFGAAYHQIGDPVGESYATISYKVSNTGNINLGAQQEVSIRGLFGSTAHATPANLPVLLPGSSTTMKVTVRGVLPEIRLSAHVTLNPLIPDGNVDTGLVASVGRTSLWAIPWVLIAIILGLGFVAWLIRRRRRRPSRSGGSKHGRGGGAHGREGTSHGRSKVHSPHDPQPGALPVQFGFVKGARRLVVVALAATISSAIPAGTALASSSLPFVDSYAHGSIGLCDKNGNSITHGSIYDKPFAWKAISSVEAPSSFRGSGQNITFYAYQPRQGVDPSNWSGEQLSGTSAYSDSAVPIAQSTNRDEALSNYLNDFPPQWDRLVELRLFFGSDSNGSDSSGYPAADLRIDGTTWTLLNGAQVDCKTGSAVSMEAALASSNPAGLQPAEALSVTAAKAVGAPVPKTPTTASGAAAASGTGLSAAPTGAASNEAIDSPRRGSHVTIVVIVAIVVLGAAAGGWSLRARRRV